MGEQKQKKFYVRKVYARMMWKVLNSRGERISVHMTQKEAEQARRHYETRA